MQSPSFLQTLRGHSSLFQHATSLDEVLCLATLKANSCSKVKTVDDARVMWVDAYDGYCPNCPYYRRCLACEINE